MIAVLQFSFEIFHGNIYLKTQDVTNLQFSFEIFLVECRKVNGLLRCRGLQFSFEIFLVRSLWFVRTSRSRTFNSLLRSSHCWLVLLWIPTFWPSILFWDLRARRDFTINAMSIVVPSILFWDLLLSGMKLRKNSRPFILQFSFEIFVDIMSGGWVLSIGMNPSILFWDLLPYIGWLLAIGYIAKSFNSLLRSSYENVIIHATRDRIAFNSLLRSSWE